MKLEKPDNTLIDDYIRIFTQKHETEERMLRIAFATFPLHRSREEILMKVILLNTVYHTRIKDKHLGDVTEHIFRLKDELDRNFHINKTLDFELVKNLSDMPEETDNIPSFATKYCSWHLPETYPIMDSYTKGMLYFLNKEYGYAEQFTKTCLNNYQFYVEKYKALIKHYSLENYTFKQIDMYLWAYAKYHDQKNVISIDCKIES